MQTTATTPSRRTWQLFAPLVVALALTGCKHSAPGLSHPRTPPARRSAAPAHQLSDAEIERAVRDRFVLDGAIDVKNVNVNVKSGVVELTGTQSNIMAKERATRVAELVRGVLAVGNRISVTPMVRRDALINADLAATLRANPVTKSYKINARSDTGTVTLEGTVSSWAAKQLAERVAKSVRGVRAVVNKLDIAYPARRTDAEVRSEVKGRLVWDALIDDGMIQVGVDDGVVKLSGVVGTLAERRRARADAWVNGTRRVDADGLVIEWWARRPELRQSRIKLMSDDSITQAVLAALRVDPRVKVFEVLVRTHDSRVTLSGQVDYVGAKLAAAELAKHTVGVVDVANKIEVKWLKEHDRAIKHAIESSLRLDALVDASKITVRVDKAIVTLTGSVATFFERAEAETVAGNTSGVRKVENALAVRSPAPRPLTRRGYIGPTVGARSISSHLSARPLRSGSLAAPCW